MELEDAVTASIGVASYRAPERPEERLTRADRALYQAKRSQRVVEFL